MSRRKCVPTANTTTYSHLFSLSDVDPQPQNKRITGYVDRISGDGRCIHRQPNQAEDTQGAPEESFTYERYDVGAGLDDYNESYVECPKTTKQSKPGDRSLYDWPATKVNLYNSEMLGHDPHKRCTTPEPSKSGFVTLHCNGIHDVLVDFCGCHLANASGPPEVQLLRVGWFPATHECPHTVATFAVLEQFHLETLQAKVTMYDFYTVLERLTNSCGLKPPDQYREWIRMCQEWRHLKLLKRGGRLTAYDCTSAAGTKPGKLAIECLACPRPGVNLPDDWQNSGDNKRHLYTFYLALDACFRLKRRLVSNELRDPGLGTGMTYILENEEYREYLRGVTDQKEMNTCSGLAALDYANTKFLRGYATMGVGMGVCARHEFVQPNGVGDLQRGERFANMDYILSSILHHKHPKIQNMVSYDIVCIWSKFLKDWMPKLPPLVRLIIIQALFSFVIPKMHIHAHLVQCQTIYSLNLTRWSAQTDSEGIERLGPPRRSGLSMVLLELGQVNWPGAREQLAEQQMAFEEFSREQAARIPAWKKKVEDFEADPTQPNPYEVKFHGTCIGLSKGILFADGGGEGLTEAQVRLRFSEEEKRQAELGVQCQIRVQAILKKANTTEMKIDLTVMRTTLSRRVAQFRKLQLTYMPAALVALGEMNIPEDQSIKNMPLVLLSAMLKVARDAGCMAGLADVEALMWDAQCLAALASLCNQLHIKSRLLVYKKNHSRHIGLHSEKYQMAWAVLSLLMETTNPQKLGWQPLKRDDIHCMEDLADLAQKAKRCKRASCRQRGTTDDDDMDVEEHDAEHIPENRRQVSWIWTVAGIAGTDAELEDALQIEWSKAYARTCRWQEEIELVEAEYEWIRLTFEYEARCWDERASVVPIGVIPRAKAEGAVAFAKEQASMFRNLRQLSKTVWTEEKVPRGKKRVHRLDPVPAVARLVLVMDAMEGGEEKRVQDEQREEEEEEEELFQTAVDSDDEEYLFLGAVEDE
ncbi:CxC2 domain-containing protein [Mycena venus]|uniref:CxC2 domain-containing protein n=1 Tax=Mycena venus TaxID=2733690 RepID=A0A8H6XRJ4_9AGAR|nr:CxC2 domain-containing protein [Mycena venus]